MRKICSCKFSHVALHYGEYRFFNYCGDTKFCPECGDKVNPKTGVITTPEETHLSADRKIKRVLRSLTSELYKTSRDKYIPVACSICKHWDVEEEKEPCCSCIKKEAIDIGANIPPLLETRNPIGYEMDNEDLDARDFVVPPLDLSHSSKLPKRKK